MQPPQKPGPALTSGLVCLPERVISWPWFNVSSVKHGDHNITRNAPANRSAPLSWVIRQKPSFFEKLGFYFFPDVDSEVSYLDSRCGEIQMPKYKQLLCAGDICIYFFSAFHWLVIIRDSFAENFMRVYPSKIQATDSSSATACSSGENISPS
jgi:hypothetical protein